MLLQGTTDFAPLFGFLDTLLPEFLDRLPSPRVICSHFPLEFLPPEVARKAKVICVFRNPKDIAVSLHNFNSHINFLDYNAKWEDYLRQFIDGNVPCGTWFNHVRGWEKVIEDNKVKNIMSLKYEDMKHNLYDTVVEIANFLGIEENVKLFSDIAKKCDFKIQHKERTTNVHELIAKINKNTPNFLYRKGEIGDWKNYFTVAQNEEFDRIYAERMKGSKLTFDFS
ncbi:hypothetical protein KUTeg_007815 [Tegillarca granosa]|uniref:Sulfotransferase domain-containing protein n=1 Tax=Tegillarca granosa TaxID=220873 RepID=A0ABQ9FEC4_TEGGR|nr:hypothetical protein KUTeg_007815 [Tegillarca granosa]